MPVPKEQDHPFYKPLWRRVVTPVAAALVASVVVGTAVWFGTRPVPPRMARFPLTTASADALSRMGPERAGSAGTRAVVNATTSPTAYEAITLPGCSISR